MNSKYEQLTTEELYLLAIYTLFDTGENNIRKVKVAMQTIMGRTYNDFSPKIKALREKNMVCATAYNWRSNSYDYTVTLSELVPSMLYFISEQKDMVKKVLDTVGKKMQPSPIQRLLWDYIISDFQNIDTELVSEYGVEECINALLPVVCDERFMPLLTHLEDSTFFDLMTSFLVDVFDKEELIDTDYLYRLFESYGNTAVTNSHVLRLRCLTELYDYMAYGRMPATLLTGNKNHRIIAALYEAYHGNMTQALEHFKKAVAINNRDGFGYAASTRSSLPLAVVNYFYLLVAFCTNTEDGKKKCSGILRSSDKNAIMLAKVLYGIISNESGANQTEKELVELLDSGIPVNRSLGKVMCLYLDNRRLLQGRDIRLKWMIMRHEARKYEPLTDEEATDKVFGTQGLLSSIYHKREWESVLDDLMGITAPEELAERDTRIAYFMADIRSSTVTVRQQTRLKNGSWGAGKNVSLATFFNGNLDCLSNEDRDIALAERRQYYYSTGIDIKSILPYMAKKSRLYAGRYAPYTLVEVTEEMPYITLVNEDDGFRITSNVPIEQIENNVIITHRGASSINFIRLTDEQKPYYQRLLSLGFFPAEAEEQLRRFLASIGGKVEVNSDLIDGGSTLPQCDGQSMLTMQMRPQDKENYVVSIFCRPLEGGNIRCTPGEGDTVLIDSADNGRTRVKRDLKAEADNMSHFADSCEELSVIRSRMDESRMALVGAYELLPLLEYAQKNPDRIACEWPEGAQLKIKQRNVATSWNGAIRKNENGWFEIEGSVEVDEGKMLTMAQLLDLVSQSRGRYIKLGDGEFIALSEKLRKQLNSLNAIASRTKGKLVMSPFSVALLGSSVTNGELVLAEDEEVKKIRRQIKESSTYSPEVPATLNATLREYQKEGYQWMSRLNKWGAGALLADDMGLGKTIQTITFLLSKAEEGPALVIAPASVAPNWKTEFQKFAPSLNISMLNFAENRREMIKAAKAGDVVVTTYGLLLSVQDDITKKKWTTICLDEAHIVKNRGAKTSAVAMQLKSQYRVMLTGTPVQNHLGELWNLFQFVNPGLLGSFEDFNRRFIIPIEQGDDKDVQKSLDKLVKPFMLRRTKDKVAKELPEKEEIYQHVDLSEEETLIYEVLRKKAEAMLMEDKSGKVSMTTLAEITRLRQCACDVRLTDKTGSASKEKEGSKIIALVELLQTILEGFGEMKVTKSNNIRVSKTARKDGGVLVFSQFTSYLALIKQALDKAGIPYLYIDGTVTIKERQRLVEQFQAGACPVFLISLKAGGLGLNLTRANYVVHMDPWWNPAIEAQATDRAHRIGQRQNVTVYHLIAAGTIEEKIQRLHEQKRELVENILESTDASHKLTGEQLLEMVHS